jgi:Bacteriocin-protection, YdeI or OmpD-Associated
LRRLIENHSSDGDMGERVDLGLAKVFSDPPRGMARILMASREFVVWYSEAKKEETRARRVEKMKQMLSAGKAMS